MSALTLWRCPHCHMVVATHPDNGPNRVCWSHRCAGKVATFDRVEPLPSPAPDKALSLREKIVAALAIPHPQYGATGWQTEQTQQPDGYAVERFTLDGRRFRVCQLASGTYRVEESKDGMLIGSGVCEMIENAMKRIEPRDG